MKENTILSFLWQVIKPYKWWYVLMLQAPIVGAIYVFANYYSIKLLVDAFAVGGDIEYSSLMKPIILFILAQIILNIAWRVSGIAEWKCEPFVRRAILLKVYDHVQHHSYTFFQNTHSGTIISKVKGILDGYDSIFGNLHHKIGKNFCVLIVSVGTLAVVNIPVCLFMVVWCIIFGIILLPMTYKLSKYNNQYAESKHKVFGLFADNITNIFTLFSFTSRKREIKHAEKIITNDLVQTCTAAYKYDFKIALVGCVLYWPMLIGIFGFMIFCRKNNLITTGDFAFVMTMTITTAYELWTFISGLSDFMKEMGDFKSSFSILQTPHKSIDKIDAMVLII